MKLKIETISRMFTREFDIEVNNFLKTIPTDHIVKIDFLMEHISTSTQYVAFILYKVNE